MENKGKEIKQEEEMTKGQSNVIKVLIVIIILLTIALIVVVLYKSINLFDDDKDNKSNRISDVVTNDNNSNGNNDSDNNDDNNGSENGNELDTQNNDKSKISGDSDKDKVVSKNNQNENDQNVIKFTGTIYRNSIDVIANGLSINERWCLIAKPDEYNEDGYSSCRYEGGDYENAFGSKEQCEAVIQSLANDSTSKWQSNAIGATCKKALPLKYETDPSKLDTNYYIKHEVINDIITSSYICVLYEKNGKKNEVCVKGGDSSYFYDSVTKNGNKIVMQNLKDSGVCEKTDFSSYLYECKIGSKLLRSRDNGECSVDDDSKGTTCYVYSDGRSICTIW